MKTSVLTELRMKLQTMAPYAKAYLFGSQARGDERPDSDWDVLILLDKPRLTPGDYDNYSFPLRELGWELGETINPVLYTLDDGAKSSFTPFHKNVTQDGIALCPVNVSFGSALD